MSNCEAVMDGLAKEIGNIMGKLRKSKKLLVKRAISIGEKLIEAKEVVDHGEFERWCDKNFSVSKSTRSKYVALAKAKKNGTLERALGGSQLDDFDGGLKSLLKLVKDGDVVLKTGKAITDQRAFSERLRDMKSDIIFLGKVGDKPKAAKAIVKLSAEHAQSCEALADKIERILASAKIKLGETDDVLKTADRKAASDEDETSDKKPRTAGEDS